jgi:hypothetical protein
MNGENHRDPGHPSRLAVGILALGAAIVPICRISDAEEPRINLGLNWIGPIDSYRYAAVPADSGFAVLAHPAAIPPTSSLPESGVATTPYYDGPWPEVARSRLPAEAGSHEAPDWELAYTETDGIRGGLRVELIESPHGMYTDADGARFGTLGLTFRF